MINTLPKEVLDPLSTLDMVETRIGTLEFKDGAPSAATVEKVYDNLDFLHAQSALRNLESRTVSQMNKGYVHKTS